MRLILGKRIDSYIYNNYNHILNKIENEIYLYFQNRFYSILVDEINIDIIYSQHFKTSHCKRPIYYEDKTVKVFPQNKNSDVTFRMYHLLFVDIPLPDEFATCSEEYAVPMIGETLVKYFTETPLPMKIWKSFDKEQFIADLQQFFENYKPK